MTEIIRKTSHKDSGGELRPKTGIPRWFPIAGFAAGVLTLAFFMVLVFLERPIECDQRFLIVIILAFGAALASAFLGGWATAEGYLPLITNKDNAIRMSVGGAVAVLVIVLIVGYWQYRCQGDERLSYRYTYQNNGKTYHGYFKNTGAGAWVEYTGQSDLDLTYRFREVESEPGWITLYDSGRGLYVRLPSGGGWAQFTENPTGPWYNLHEVTPISGTN